MSKPSSIRYFASRNAYYTQINGKQHLLAKGTEDAVTYQRAVEAFEALLQTQGSTKPTAITLHTLYIKYLDYLSSNDRSKDKALTVKSLKVAVEKLGQLSVCTLRVHHIQSWIEYMKSDRGIRYGVKKQWGDTTVRIALVKFNRLLNWGVDQGYLLINPIQISKLGTTAYHPRQSNIVITPAEHLAMVNSTPSYFRHLIQFFYATGCRPSEAYNLQAKHYNAEGQFFRYQWNVAKGEFVHKTAKRIKKDRLIFVPDSLVEMVKTRIEFDHRYVFVNRDKNQWNNSSVGRSLERCLQRLNWSHRPIIPYSYRHTFATDWILKGGSLKILGELLGTSVHMLDKYYGHLDVDLGVLLRVVNEMRR